jgi:hypothetical protein
MAGVVDTIGQWWSIFGRRSLLPLVRHCSDVFNTGENASHRVDDHPADADEHAADASLGRTVPAAKHGFTIFLGICVFALVIGA